MHQKAPILLLAVIFAGAGWWLAGSSERAVPVSHLEPGKRQVRGPSTSGLAEQPGATPAENPPNRDGKPAAGPETHPLIPNAAQAFTAWTDRYFKAPAAEREHLVAEGAQIAEARRPEFKQLIQSDPKRAIEMAVPMVVRQQLPQAVVAKLEERVSGRAVLRVYQSTPVPNENPAGTVRVAEFQNGKTYAAFAYGRRAEKVIWTPDASLNGVALDHQLAVNEDPLRVLEVGEIPDRAKPTVTLCPVSGLKTAAPPNDQPVTESTPAVEVYGEIVYLCNGSHTTVYRQTIVQAEGGTGGPTTFTGLLPAAPTPSLGTLKILYIPLTFQDQNAVPATEQKCYDVMRDVSDYYAKSSYGRLTTLTTVTPPIKLPRDEAWYVQKDTSNGGDIDGLGLEQTHARDEARKIGFDSNDFDCVVLRLNGGARPTGGWGGGGSVWVYGDSIGVVAHEIGHTFGLSHANFWDTAGTSAIGSGANAEYGDVFDVMGGGGVPTDHYNAQAKNQIKWLPNNYIQTIAQSGQYRIYAFDQPSLEPSKSYAMKIVKDATRTYWGEFRQLYTGNATRPWADKGLILGWNFPSGSGSNIQLIDTTPGSPYGKDDSPISIGRTFSDFESGIHITTLAVSSTTPKYVDFVVNMGSFPGNNAPTLSLASSAGTVPTGTTVTFTATASDPDGDTLAYSWQHFGDTSVRIVSPNASTITRTFSTAGSYIVSCTVSDMKGGTCTRTKLITVGSGNSRYIINGRVTMGGVGLPNVTMTANNANGVITDNDGYYSIPNLVAGTYVVTPLLYGYNFSELFNNSITVAPNYSGANFSATTDSTVSIVASIPNASEAGPTAGKFTITRTGDTTLALAVNAGAATGSATKTTDYAFSPDYVSSSPFNQFTIPAGQASLDILVNPVNDALVEGPETVILQLGPGDGYVLSGSTSATVTIADDDTTLPKVAVVTTTPSTIENSGLPAVFTFSRTGATTGSLTVNYAVTGTATPGADYTTLTGSVTIPAGSSSTTVNVQPVDDNISESLETVIVTISSNAGYIIDPANTTATVSIIDDDVQIVNVIATDATAAEVDLTVPGAKADTATFLVTRTGDTSQPLTVYYSVSGVNGTGVNAIHGVDYEALPGVLVIPAGETSAAVTIMPRFDGLGEGPENVQFQLGAGPTNYQLGPNNNATITINDNATDTPYIGVIQMTNAAEPATNGIFRISARGAGTGVITVNYTMSGTAVAGTDYNITGIGSTTLTLNNGAEVTKDISVVPVNNATADPLRTITMTLTPAATYQMFAPTSAATMWLRDDDQPTVYVDAHQTTTPPTISETGSASKFYLSRTGSTAAALTVNYTMSGTAVNGTDYATVTGTATIAAGTTGVDVIITPTNNAIFTGTRTIILNLAAGSYAAGPGATMYLTDDEPSTQKVGFATSGATGSVNVTSVSIPVSLISGSVGTTTVEYWADTGSRSSSSTTMTTVPTPTLALPYWVRVVRNGTAFTNYYSLDGTNWIQRGSTQTIAMSSTSYLVGLAAAGGTSGSTCAGTFDGVTVTGLDAGGTAGAAVSTNVGSPSPAGSDSHSSGGYTITGGGSPDLSTGTSEGFRYVYFPISNSNNCTITARLTSLAATVASGKIGVMIRESTANNARHSSTMVLQDPTSLWQIYRLSTAGSGVTSTTNPVLKPWWVRLQRAGSVFTSWGSPDGANWTQVGASQTIVLSPEVLAGLAVSARSDGLLSTATFDNMTLTGSPVTLQGRTVGFVNAQGSDSLSAGVYTVTGSGAAIGGTEDECHFVAAPITGDFLLTARVLTQSGGASNAQAGVMIRETGNYRCRSLYTGMVANASQEFIYRTSTVTNALGDGIDHTLTSGLLTFNNGDTTQNINFNVINDALTEPNESVVITLKNPFNAVLGTISQFTYTIINNDTPPALPYVGFAASTSSVPENAGADTIWVTLSTPATSALSVDYAITGGTAVNGTDFTLAAGTLNFATGDSALPITVPIIDNTTIQPNRTGVITLSNPVNALPGSQSTHTFTIVDDDLPVVSIVANLPNAAEGGAAGQFTVSRTGPTTSALTVNYSLTGSTATNGTDYTTIPTSITIPVGQSSAVINVVTIQDSLNEGTETVIVTLSTNAAYTVGSPGTATVFIADDDRPVVNIVANQPNAAEGGVSGQFTITRSGATGIAITVNISTSGTATSTADYTALPTAVAFAANQTTATLNVVPVNDTLIEGPESVMVTLVAGTYDIGANNFAVVTIADNDVPPSIYISSPSAQGALIASGNGLMVAVTATDDGLPSPLTYSWVQASGPGTATFETPGATTSAVTFSADGVYVLKVNVSDGQFTVSDQVTVIVGAAIAPADWLAHDLTPSLTQRGQSWLLNNTYTLTGMGAGYAGTTDGAHVMIRPVSGNSTIMARLTSVTGAAIAPFAGVTMRDSEFRGSRRAALGYVPGVGLQFRTRTTSSAADTVTTQGGITLPIWLKLDRDATTNNITASYASDASGAPGSWTQLGTPTVIAMDTLGIANIGLTATGTSTTNATTAVFDNVTPTPAISAGGALLAEDGGTSNPTAGTSSYNSGTGTWTIAATGALDSGGYFVGQQYFGDFIVTAKLASASSGALNALSGIMIRESMDTGGYVFLGRIPSGAFSGYLWRNYASGTTGGVPSFTNTVRWMRLVRTGNTVTAYHAPDASGSPGVWIPLGQPQTVIMTTAVLVGLAVDNNGGGSVVNTATFNNFSIVPLNKAPIVGTGTVTSPVIASISLSGSVTDDSFPSPPNLTTQWSTHAGPAAAVFGNASLPATTVTFPANGSYTLRLQADDGSVQTFADVNTTAYLGPFDQWQAQSFGSNTDPAAAQAADFDHDGLPNLLEYALGTSGTIQNTTPIVSDFVSSGSDKYLRITVPRNPNATDVTMIVEATGNLAHPASWSSTGLIILQNTSTLLQVQDNVPATDNAPRFMRVRVAKP